MSSLWGTQPPLCRYSPLSTSPRQHTTPGHLLHTTDSSSPLQLLLLLLSLSPQSKVHPCLCTSQVLGSWLPSLWGHWELGGQATSCTCVSDYVSSSFTVLYSTVFTLLQSPSILLYCILFPVTLYSHINFTKGTITHKQTNLLYSHYCTVLYC